MREARLRRSMTGMHSLLSLNVVEARREEAARAAADPRHRLPARRPRRRRRV
jgi:hypothetical protein